MIEMSNCPNCASVYEKGDKFCQDCGQPLGDGASLRGLNPKKMTHDARDFDSLFSKIGPLNLLQLNKAPAELILLAAAVVYIASAVIWSYHDSLGAMLARVPGLHLRWKLPVLPISKPRVATKSGAPVQMQSLQPAGKPAESRPEKKIEEPAKKVVVEPAVKPAAATARTDMEPLALPAPAAQPKVHTNPEEIKDVAEYNRLLADYFSRHQADPQAGEPPSFPEWIAGKKQSF